MTTPQQPPQAPQGGEASADRALESVGAEIGLGLGAPRPRRAEDESGLHASSREGPLSKVRRVGFQSPRLRTLVAIRWLAIAGQSVSVIVATLVLGLDLPLTGCVAAIAASTAFNITLTFAKRPSQRLSDREAVFNLLFDLGQLVGLLYLTGGIANPFALFLLAPVTISATVLTLRTTVLLALVSIAAATFLSQSHMPLVFQDGRPLDPPPLYLAGFWVAIAVGVAFQAAYTRRVSVEAFDLTAAFAATQMALEREQRLSAIGALAAAAAHELGTPLATIKLVAKEMASDLKDRPDLAEDALLIADQAARCRDILQRLSISKAPEDAQMKRAPISAVVEEAAEPHQDRRARIILRVDGAPITADDPGPPQPEIRRAPELIHGLRNLVQNAVDFAASTVWIDIESDDERISITIGDDGAGFSDEILNQLGEPFTTTRGKGMDAGEDAYQGMGLGVFISKTLLERTGGEVAFENAAPGRRRDRTPKEQADPTGAVVRVVWPRARLAE